MGWTGKNPMDWARETEQRLTAVNRRSVELLADEMRRTHSNGGRLPHKTGNLMRSLLASTTSMPSVGAPGTLYSGGQDVGLITAQLELGQTVYLGYQANYAKRLNYGFVGEDSLGRKYEQEGLHFAEWAAGQWPQLVAKAAKEMMTKVMSR